MNSPTLRRTKGNFFFHSLHHVKLMSLPHGFERTAVNGAQAFVLYIYEGVEHAKTHLSKVHMTSRCVSSQHATPFCLRLLWI